MLRVPLVKDEAKVCHLFLLMPYYLPLPRTKVFIRTKHLFEEV